MGIKKLVNLSSITSIALAFSINMNSSNAIQRGGSKYVCKSFASAEDFALDEVEKEYKNKANLNIKYNGWGQIGLLDCYNLSQSRLNEKYNSTVSDKRIEGMCALVAATSLSEYWKRKKDNYYMQYYEIENLYVNLVNNCIEKKYLTKKSKTNNITTYEGSKEYYFDNIIDLALRLNGLNPSVADLNTRDVYKNVFNNLSTRKAVGLGIPNHAIPVVGIVEMSYHISFTKTVWFKKQSVSEYKRYQFYVVNNGWASKSIINRTNSYYAKDDEYNYSYYGVGLTNKGICDINF